MSLDLLAHQGVIDCLNESLSGKARWINTAVSRGRHSNYDVISSIHLPPLRVDLTSWYDLLDQDIEDIGEHERIPCIHRQLIAMGYDKAPKVSGKLEVKYNDPVSKTLNDLFFVYFEGNQLIDKVRGLDWRIPQKEQEILRKLDRGNYVRDVINTILPLRDHYARIEKTNEIIEIKGEIKDD